MRIIYPDVTETIHAIIQTRALPVEAFIPYIVACTVCSGYDPFCSGCHGLGQQRVFDHVTLSGIVRWDNIDEKRAYQTGLVYRGDATCVFPYTATVYSGQYGVYSGERGVTDQASLYRVDTTMFEQISRFFEGRPYNRVVVVLRQVDTV